MRNKGFLGAWMAITHWAGINSLSPVKEIPTRFKGMGTGPTRGIPLQRITGSTLYQGMNGQMYSRNAAGTFFRVHSDGTRQFRRGN